MPPRYFRRVIDPDYFDPAARKRKNLTVMDGEYEEISEDEAKRQYQESPDADDQTD